MRRVEKKNGDLRRLLDGGLIRSLEELAEELGRIPVVLYCRVSDRSQSANLDNQEEKLRRMCKNLGLRVVDVFREVVSGWKLEKRPNLIAAVAKAKRVNGIVVAESLDRFVRGWEFHYCKNAMAPADEEGIAWLAKLADGVPLGTAIPPDSTFGKVRQQQTERGKKAKCEKDGRPKKNSRRVLEKRKTLQLPRVLDLLLKGKSYRQIWEELGVAKSTVGDWVGEVEGNKNLIASRRH